MAGIGFELRKHLSRDTYEGMIKAYCVAGVVGSGPWVICILGTLLIGVFSHSRVSSAEQLQVFFASVTSLVAVSLLFSGTIQIALARYISDRIYEERHDRVLPNLFGAIVLNTVASGTFASLIALGLLEGSAAYRALMIATFVTLTNVWLLSVFLSSIKEYWLVVTMFFIGYVVAVGLAIAWAPHGEVGLLGGFLVGQIVLQFGMLGSVIRAYPSRQLMTFDFARRDIVLGSLAVIGFLYHLGVWIDKFVFWLNPSTSIAVQAPIRISPVYDIPIFLAYLSCIPGMTVFLMRIETDFAHRVREVFGSIREGGTLDEIEDRRNAMVRSIRSGIRDILQIQGITAVAVIFAGPTIFQVIGIPETYLHLFRIDVVGVAVQVVLLSILTVCFYLDFRRLALGLCVLFVVGNLGLTLVTHVLGPRFYGCGFAVSVTVAAVVGAAALGRKLDRLEYEVFMR
ncbi:MAG: exopolysaccharide Pel transporter PelG [Myxococcota bacterium]